jgi:hypothetical protein
MKLVHVILYSGGLSYEVYTIGTCLYNSQWCFVLVDTEVGVCDGDLSLSICRAVILDQKSICF